MNKLLEDIKNFFIINKKKIKDNIKKIKNCFFDVSYFSNFSIKEKNNKIVMKNVANIFLDNENIVIKFDNSNFLKKFYINLIKDKNFFDFICNKNNIFIKLKKNINKRNISILIKKEKEFFLIKIRTFLKKIKNKLKNMLKLKQINVSEKRKAMNIISNNILLFKNLISFI
ncbi:hypothetical protein [Candidatus Vidania fulgoroideorum]